MNETLSPHERIRRKKDFLLLYKKGSRYRGKYFTLIYHPREFSFSRIGVVAGKKIGNAVQRNKIKRWIRTIFRTNKDLLKISFDLVFIMKKEIHEAGFSNLKQEYINSLKSICREVKSS